MCVGEQRKARTGSAEVGDLELVTNRCCACQLPDATVDVFVMGVRSQGSGAVNMSCGGCTSTQKALNICECVLLLVNKSLKRHAAVLLGAGELLRH